MGILDQELILFKRGGGGGAVILWHLMSPKSLYESTSETRLLKDQKLILSYRRFGSLVWSGYRIALVINVSKVNTRLHLSRS